MLHFEPFSGTLDDWGKILDTFPDREIFQTPAWLRFLAESQCAQPVILVLKDGHSIFGYFAGLVIRKAGLKILGSPFVGWTTDRMGLRLQPDVDKNAAVKALMDYAFRHLGCIHLEATDLNITPDDVASLGTVVAVCSSSVIDLTADEDVLYSNMSAKSCRYSIRKAEKLGVVIEEAHDEGFADDYYGQLCDVFAKQGLIPTYGKQRVQSLIRHLLPTGNLLLLRAREPGGRCIATGIFLGMHDYAYFWGNASWREDQHFCPNEALHWYAIRYWKRRGMRYYDFCGGGDYKRKYGGRPVESYRFWKSRYRWIGWARTIAEGTFHLYQRLAGRRRNDAPLLKRAASAFCLMVLVDLALLAVLAYFGAWKYSLGENVVMGVLGLAVIASYKSRWSKAIAEGRNADCLGAVSGQRCLDSLLLLGAGVLLLIPGIVSDVLGLSLLVPWVRKRVARFLWPSE